MGKTRWPYGADGHRKNAICATRSSRELDTASRATLTAVRKLLAGITEMQLKANPGLVMMKLGDAVKGIDEALMNTADALACQADAERFLVLARYGEDEEPN